MNRIAHIAEYLRNIIEKKDEVHEPSGGFLSHRIRKKAAALISKDGRLLDLGSGEGLLLNVLRPSVSKWIYGADIEEGWLEKASKRAAHRKKTLFILCEGRKLPFENDSFEEVVILNLFMNIPNITVVTSFLREALRVCSLHGKVIFDCRNIRNPWIFTLYKTVNLHDPDIKLPLRAFTKWEIKGVLLSLGIQSGVVYHSIPSWWLINPPVYLVEIKKGLRK